MNGSCFETKWTHRTKQHLLTATQAWYFWYEGFQRHPLLWPTKNVTIPDHAGASMWDTSNTSNDIYIYILCYPPKTYLLLIFGVAHVLDILFLAAYIITWCRIIEGKYPFRCQKIHTYTYIYDYIYRDIYIYDYIYNYIYIIIYMCVHTCTWLLHCDLSRSLKIKHVWKRHGTVSKCKDFTWCSFLCLGLLQHFTPNLNNFSCLYLNVFEGTLSGRFW